MIGLAEKNHGFQQYFLTFRGRAKFPSKFLKRRPETFLFWKFPSTFQVLVTLLQVTKKWKLKPLFLGSILTRLQSFLLKPVRLFVRRLGDKKTLFWSGSILKQKQSRRCYAVSSVWVSRQTRKRRPSGGRGGLGSGGERVQGSAGDLFSDGLTVNKWWETMIKGWNFKLYEI